MGEGDVIYVHINSIAPETRRKKYGKINSPEVVGNSIIVAEEILILN